MVINLFLFAGYQFIQMAGCVFQSQKLENESAQGGSR